MTHMIRLAGFVLILVTTVVVAEWQQPGEANDLDLKMRTVSYWLDPNRKRMDELITATQIEKQNLDEKELAVQKLLDGKATLLETAAIFYRLNRRIGIQPCYPEFAGCAPEELACIQVIRWVAHHASGTPLLTARLEEELRLRKEQYGTAILPDVESPF